MKTGILAISEGGKRLAAELHSLLPESILLENSGGVSQTMADNWHEFDGFICIMATGIVVRAIAPHLQDKRIDPAVIVMDQKGKHVISLLSGHLGGGNELAEQVANLTGGVPVITTASDTLGLAAVDLWARDHKLTASKTALTLASVKLVNKGCLRVFSEVDIQQLPQGLIQVKERREADIIVSNCLVEGDELIFHPQNLVVGVGCNRGTPMEEFEEALHELFQDVGLSRHSIRNLTSIDVKNDEVGLLAFAEKNYWPLEYFTKDEINRVTDLDVSSAAMKAVGAIGVAEPTALLSAESTHLLSRKRKWKNITMAVAQASFTL